MFDLLVAPLIPFLNQEKFGFLIDEDCSINTRDELVDEFERRDISYDEDTLALNPEEIKELCAEFRKMAKCKGK